MPETHEARRERLRDLAHGAGAEAALVTWLVNVRYLTGFTGSNAALLVTRPSTTCSPPTAATSTQAGQQAPDVELLVDRECAAGAGRRGGARPARAGWRSRRTT